MWARSNSFDLRQRHTCPDPAPHSFWRLRSGHASTGRVLPMRFARAAALLLVVLLHTTSPAWAEEPTKLSPVEVTAFQLFELRQELLTVSQLVRTGQLAVAENTLNQIIKRGPELPVLHYTLAIVRVGQGKLSSALDSLEAAIAQGFRGAENVAEDARLALLRKDPRFTELLRKVRDAPPAKTFKVIDTIAPASVTDATAMVNRTNTAWDEKLGILRSYFTFGDKKPTGPVYRGSDKSAFKLNHLYAKGHAAGNYGDLYDNRDRNHSNLTHSWLPQLTYVEYSSEAKRVHADYNLNSFLFFNAITIGNASLARTNGPLWRSLPRNVFTQVDGPARLFLQYVNNHLYVYPEHADHDPKHGDLFPANTPYMIVSQGSSRSDKPFLQAVGVILAAFTPETKKFLREKHLVMPTVQMIFRRGQRFVREESTYLTGVTHPSVFRSDDIDLTRMIALTSRLRQDDVPPLPLLRVVEESAARLGVDHFAPGMSEKLFDTPSAIGRVIRSTAYTKRLVISAEQTRDPNGRELSFHWSVLRGDAQRIVIRPLNETGSKVELTVPWHERHRVPGRPKLMTDRVDIALFAHNGKHYSAPAFVSFMYPGDQLREYDDRQRLLRVDYAPTQMSMKDRYVDPVLFPERDWSDTYEYDGEGNLLGWRRVRGTETTRFTRHGAKVVSSDALERPAKAMVVRYALEPVGTGSARVVEQASERFVTYEYSDDADRLGTMRTVVPN